MPCQGRSGALPSPSGEEKVGLVDAVGEHSFNPITELPELRHSGIDTWAGEGCKMGIKADPTHKMRIQVLRQMPPEKRLLAAFELTELTQRLFIQGLRKRFPGLSAGEFKGILLKRLAKCHNRNY